MGWSHVYATAHGEWTGSTWVGETGQIGFRWSVRTLGPGPAFPAPDYPEHGAQFVDGSDATFNYSSNWHAVADVGGGAYYTLNTAFQTDMAHDFATFLNSVKAYQSNAFRWSHIKLSLVARHSKSAGKSDYVLYPASVYAFKTPVPGAVSTQLPPECAIAVSTRVNVVGRRGRGRMYIPAIGSSANDGNTGTVTSTARTGLATAMQALYDNVANLPGGDPLLMNQGLIITSPGASQVLVPKEVRVGNHMDVQRRRQHQVSEVYTSLPLT